MSNTGASFVPFTRNAKLGHMAASAVAQVTCPATCSFRNSGCYAEGGNMRFHTAALNKTQNTADEVIAAEAAAIVNTKIVKGFILRLHTVGDCLTDNQARTLSAAADSYVKRGGGNVFTYTHSWRSIKHESWQATGKIHVLASCESPNEVQEAKKLGYRTALVVEDFKPETLKALKEQGIHGVPCPAQTQEEMTCAECRYCAKDANGTVLFEAHGSSKKKALLQIGRKKSAV